MFMLTTSTGARGLQEALTNPLRQRPRCRDNHPGREKAARPDPLPAGSALESPLRR